MSTPSPLPTRRPLTEEEAPRLRRLHCRTYNHCLDVAARADWPGFVCVGCRALEPLTAAQEAADLDALLELVARARRA